MSIEDDVRAYLEKSAAFYQKGQPEYYARLALEQAAIAYEEGNYGIGAVAVLATSEGVSEYPNRNAMITGVGVIDHAETRALIDIRSGHAPNITYPRDTNDWTRGLADGISMYGTLEPCPMCASTLTSVGAKLSVSTVLDGQLVEVDGFKQSDGAANAIGDKGKIQPQVWRWIQSETGLRFILLDTEDSELVALSQRIFDDTRESVDRSLADRSK